MQLTIHTFIFTFRFLDIDGEVIFNFIIENCWVSLCLWSFYNKDDGATLKCSSVSHSFHCSHLLLAWAACSGSAFSRSACLQRTNPSPGEEGLLRIERLCWWSCLLAAFQTAQERCKYEFCRKHLMLVCTLGFFKNWFRGSGEDKGDYFFSLGRTAHGIWTVPKNLEV